MYKIITNKSFTDDEDSPLEKKRTSLEVYYSVGDCVYISMPRRDGENRLMDSSIIELEFEKDTLDLLLL